LNDFYPLPSQREPLLGLMVWNSPQITDQGFNFRNFESRGLLPRGLLPRVKKYILSHDILLVMWFKYSNIYSGEKGDGL